MSAPKNRSEAVAAYRKRLIYKFRAIARLARINAFWLIDAEDSGNIVEKTVKMLTSSHKKGKDGSLLSLQDKAILCRPVELRTEAEKIRLGKIIGGLKCFRRYPNHVKNQLAGVTYFVYYPPGRVIVREKQEAHATYLIVTGEVNVSIVAFDPLFHEYHVKLLGSMGPGDMFGEVSLLHDIPRTATITTLTSCELLQIKKVDFERVLKASVKEQWDKTQELMKHFDYFDHWDEVAVRECCILSRIVNFKEGQLVMQQNDVNKNFVFFLTEGRCKIIEKMHIEKRRDMWGIPKFKLYVSKDKSVKKPVVKLSDGDIFLLKKPSTFLIPTKVKVKKKKSLYNVLPKVDTKWPHKIHNRYSISYVEEPEPRKSKTTVDTPNAVDDKTSNTTRIPAIEFAKTVLPDYVKTFFMQVCTLEQTACFGLGENMENRFVVADTSVECLLIPRYWISQRNYQKIWDRIVGYMNRTIPSSEKVYQLFYEHRQWLLYRMKLFRENYKRQGSIFNTTSITDLPYSIRTNSELDVYELYSYNFKIMNI